MGPSLIRVINHGSRPAAGPGERPAPYPPTAERLVRPARLRGRCGLRESCADLGHQLGDHADRRIDGAATGSLRPISSSRLAGWQPTTRMRPALRTEHVQHPNTTSGCMSVRVETSGCSAAGCRRLCRARARSSGRTSSTVSVPGGPPAGRSVDQDGVSYRWPGRRPGACRSSRSRRPDPVRQARAARRRGDLDAEAVVAEEDVADPGDQHAPGQRTVRASVMRPPRAGELGDGQLHSTW